MDDNSTVVDDILVNDRPGRCLVHSGILPVREATPKSRLATDMGTYIPTSQTISEVSGDDRIRPRISQECITVSPLASVLMSEMPFKI